ncbi:hypothetical protein BRADI_2g03137v3 [Brachypodium distachyon]|uniref:Uncharacterized protein n=1 Tax=Brachypodium distachyon TaxID=15368 RepID=A0A2K2D6L9_BRADI|nr:hypothetical protein BRADI_2g03137v3 [Brachypodium distachyon]
MAGNMDESYWSRNVFQEFEFSVARLNFRGRFLGNGFVVHCDEEGTCLLMTCRHIFEDVRDPWSAAVDAYFSRSNDPFFRARLLYLDETRDLSF